MEYVGPFSEAKVIQKLMNDLAKPTYKYVATACKHSWAEWKIEFLTKAAQQKWNSGYQFKMMSGQMPEWVVQAGKLLTEDDLKQLGFVQSIARAPADEEE